MAELHKIIASVKDALGAGARNHNSHAETASAAVPVAASAQRAELASTFARELEEVGGKFLGVLAPGEVNSRIVSLAGEIGAKTVALGQGLALDMDAVGEALERADFRIVRTVPVADSERAAMRARVADAELGIAEADFAIASTGTLAVVANAESAGLAHAAADGEPGDRSDRSRDAESRGGAGRDGSRRRRRESIDVDHGAEPDRGYRKANRARRAWPEIAARDRGVAAR